MLDVIKIIKEKKPLIHNITNYVTINDVANTILAIGGKPIMAEYKGEVEEITAIADGLNINMGMINPDKLEAMILAGKQANKNGIAVVLDPVGCGASQFRKDAIRHLVNEVHFTAIKGNISEIKTILDSKHNTLGVDVSDDDLLSDTVKLAKEVAKKLDTIIIITGERDIISDGKKTYECSNGHEMMASVTGTGCSLSGLLTTFLSVDPTVDSALEAVAVMGIAGEKAYDRLKENDGNLTYREKIIDAIYYMNDKMVKENIQYVIK